MPFLRRLGDVLSWPGLAALAGAVALLLAARFGPPGQGWEDLARLAGAMLLAALAGLLSGGALLAWRAARSRPSAWRRWAAILGAAVGALAGAGLAAALASGLPQGNVGPVAFGAASAAVGVAGILAATMR